MRVRKGFLAVALTGVIGFGFLAAPSQANASESGRRNTAIALGAASIYLLTHHQQGLGIVGLGATAYAIDQLDNSIDRRDDRRHRDDWNRGPDRRQANWGGDRDNRRGNDHDWDDWNRGRRTDHDWDDSSRGRRNDHDRDDRNRRNDHDRDDRNRRGHRGW